MKRTGYVEIEHLEHQAALLREKLRLMRTKALLDNGWFILNFKSSCGPKYSGPRFVPPGAVKLRRGDRHFEAGFTKYSSMYRSAADAFVILRSKLRRDCGPTSCEREPRRKGIE